MENSQNRHEYVLEMEGISKEFPGVKALDNVTLKIRPNSVHALMGENGAGKSTLMKCLFGIYKKDTGEISLEGQKIEFKNSKDALERGVSMVHQELNQVTQRNVMDNIWLGRYPKKGLFIDEDKMYKDTKEIFAKLDIDIDPRTKVSRLSVSQMQMLEIAKAVSYDSKVLILDEPGNNLDSKSKKELYAELLKLNAQGITVVMITHDLDHQNLVGNKILALADGVATMETTEEYVKRIHRHDHSEGEGK